MEALLNSLREQGIDLRTIKVLQDTTEKDSWVTDRFCFYQYLDDESDNMSRPLTIGPWEEGGDEEMEYSHSPSLPPSRQFPGRIDKRASSRGSRGSSRGPLTPRLPAHGADMSRLAERIGKDMAMIE